MFSFQKGKQLSNHKVYSVSNTYHLSILTLPSSTLLYEFFVKAGSMCLKICYCNHYLMWLVLLLLCGHK